jgi:Xaa-Pro aminopeptidase
MEEGMVTSDEPGVYVDGKFGIRIENEILCEKDLENEYGTFLKFSWLTLVPIDRELIDVQFLSKVDIDRLNRYHELVFRVLSPFVSGEKLEYLSEVTAPLEA